MYLPEHDLLPCEWGGVAPAFESALGGLYGLLHLELGALGHLGHDLVGGGVVDVNPALRLGLDVLVVQPHGRVSRHLATREGQAPGVHGATDGRLEK